MIDYDAIKASVRISEVLDRYVRVPSRDRYRVPCPIHGGEHDNLAVDNLRGLWHCFTCAEAGDVVSLYAKLEDISNSEAAKRLMEEFSIRGQKINVPFRAVVNELRSWEPRTELPEIQLPESKPLNGYRKYSKEAIDHFGLRLVDTGVLIPSTDINGRIVGYSIRQTYKEPKYLNSAGLKKSEILWGLSQNKNSIVSASFVVLVEGQLDAVRVWDFGVKNVVSSMGAGLSPTQAHLLVPLVSKIIVLYDGDEKGRDESRKVKENYNSLFRIEIKEVPSGEDPDRTDLRAIFK